MIRAIGALESRSRVFHYGLVLLLLTVVGIIDGAMDRDLSFVILYFVPVLEAAWFLGKREGYAACLLSGAAWIIDDLRNSASYGHPLIAYWNLGAKLALFVILVSIVTALRESIEHQRRLEREKARRELEIARQVQSRLLPQSLPAFETLELAAAYRPAGDVGGDYYDWLFLEQDLLGLAVADISGKGLAGALLMASLQGMLRSNAHSYGSRTSEFLGQLNRLLFHSTDSGMYATLFYCTYRKHDRTLRYVNAGHNPALLLKSDHGDPQAKHVIRLERGGPPVGILERSAYEDCEIALQKGDLLVIFTDGVTEAVNQQEEEFGEERLVELVSSLRDGPASVIGDRVLEEVTRFAGDQPQGDDITLMVVKVV